MPDPRKSESKQDYLKRCTAQLVGEEGKEADKAFAQCNSMWQQAKKNGEHSELRRPFNLAAPIQLEDIPSQEDKAVPIAGFLINAYTGKPVEMGWMGKFIFDVEGIQAMDQMPVLRQHSHDRIVGASSKFWKDKNNVFIQGKFSKATDDSREVRELAEEGYPWQASVGIWPLEVEYLAEEKEATRVNGMEVQGPIEIWKKSQIREVSFVSLGADEDTAGIGIHLSNSCPVSVQVQYSKNNQEKEVKQMELKELLEKLVEAKPSIDDLALSFPDMVEHYKKLGKEEGEKGYIKQGREMGEEKERERIAEILEAKADSEITLKAIKDGTASADFYKLAYDHMRGVQDDKLAKLAKETPKPVVPAEPQEMTITDLGDAHVKVAELATELAKKEGIPMDKATNRVLNENPKLKVEYLASFNS